MYSSPRTIAGLVLLGLCVTGCSTVHSLTKSDSIAGDAAEAAQASAPAKGTVEFGTTPDALAKVMPEAMADLKMTYIRTRKNGTALQIDGKTADRRSVLVTIRPGLGKSRVNSRIGWFGDSLLSKALAERLGVRAGLLPPKPIPDEPPSSPDPNPLFSRTAVSDEEMYRDLAEAPYRDGFVP